MKKIAVITPDFSGSTFPLEKRLVRENLVIDHYQIIRRHINELESFPFKYNSFKFGVKKIAKKRAFQLYDYINHKNFSFNVINLPHPCISYPILRNISSLITKIFLKKIVKKINKNNYDVILLIGIYNNQIFPFIIENLTTKNIIVALHEVCDHGEKEIGGITPLLSDIKLFNLPIIVFSQKSLNDIYKYGIFKQEKIHLMHFGLFEGYSIYASENNFDLPSQYILFIGAITSYKGLDVLYKSVCEKKWPCKFVIAGKGHSEYVEKMKNDNRFIVINRFLNNSEFVELIKKCKYIVCPYKSMSQSGIPQTAFLFNKPIIASNLEGFKEIINNGENGLFFKTENATSLSEEMYLLLNNHDLYCQMQIKIKKRFLDSKDLFSWDNIAKEYINLFNEIHND